jgi:ribose transport system substrate-binding protein
VHRSSIEASISPGPRRTRVAAISVAVLLGLATAACGGNSDSGGSGQSGNAAANPASVQEAKDLVTKGLSAPKAIPQTAPLTKAVPTGKSIIFGENGNPATAVIGKAVGEAAKAVGWGFSEVTYDPANPATLQSALTSALSKNPSAVVITGVSPDKFGQPVLDAYKKAGVPIVSAGVCITTAVAAPVVQGPSGCDQEKSVGKLLADWIVSDSGGKASVMHAFVTGLPSYSAFGEGLETELKAKCPACSLKTVTMSLQQVSDKQVVPTVVNSLRSNKNINYVISDNGVYFDGIQASLSAAGVTDVKIGGRQADPAMIAALQGGDKGAWSASSYPLLGYAAFDDALRTVLGDSGTENNLVSPIQLLTSTNSAGVATPYNEPTDALQQYVALWTRP